MPEPDEEWTAADEWASWMFPGAYLPRYEDLPKVDTGFSLRPPLHERIQALIDEIDPRREACSGDLRGRTPGETRRVSPSSVRMKWLYEDDGFAAVPDDPSYRTFGPEVTVGDIEDEDDLLDAARMFVAGQEHELKTEAVDEVTRRTAALNQDPDHVDWEEMADDLERHGPDDLMDEVYIHPSVFPGDARTLGEAEALVGMHPKHETLEELPGPCILCGADEVYVTVRRDVDGEIVWSELTCQDCGWEVNSDERQPSPAEEVPRYCPSCGADRVRVSITYEEGEPVKTELQCSECEPGAGQA